MSCIRIFSYNVPTPSHIARGYTGHEHLDGFGLFNMNGRMYDPVIGRVLNPDAFVQAPGYTQSYNRYSYCMNNPLRYTDPSGWQMAALGDYWNLGKAITDFTSFSGRRASSGDNGGGGGGWGGNGGAVPTWYGSGDYSYYWRQAYSSVNNLCNSNIVDGVYSLNNVDYSNGIFSFSFNYSTKGTIELNRAIATFQKEKAFHDEMELAAASNIEYGKSFGGPYDDLVEMIREIWYSPTMINLVPDLITLSVDFSCTPFSGIGRTYQLNFLFRGKEPGVFLTNTLSQRIGFEADFGLNLGWGYFNRNYQNLYRKTLLDTGYDLDFGDGFGGSIWTSGNNILDPIWVGGKGGFGITLGVSVGKGNTSYGILQAN